MKLKSAALIACVALVSIAAPAAKAEVVAELQYELGTRFYGRVSLSVDDDELLVGNSSYSTSTGVYDRDTGDFLRFIDDIAYTSVVGNVAIGRKGAFGGATQVYGRSDDELTHRLLPDDYAAGDDFGISSATDGTLVLVGSYRDDDNGLDSGSAYLFNAETGQQVRKLLPSDGRPRGKAGVGVAIGNGIAVVGAPSRSPTEGGAAYVFDVSTG